MTSGGGFVSRERSPTLPPLSLSRVSFPRAWASWPRGTSPARRWWWRSPKGSGSTPTRWSPPRSGGCAPVSSPGSPSPSSSCGRGPWARPLPGTPISAFFRQHPIPLSSGQKRSFLK
ncbi:unnamed protein product [Musa hybrid cultivar]